MPKLRLFEVGHRFGRWEVLAEPWMERGKRLYLLRCSCGAERATPVASMSAGHSTSCGCAARNALTARNTSHGQSGSLVYRAWKNMHRRCRATEGWVAESYFKRGIKVCSRWASFPAFLQDMGDLPFPGATLERRNNSKGYSKSNCVWLPKPAQARNTSKTIYVSYRGKRRKLVELVEAGDLNYRTVYRRIYQLGWSLERALETGVSK